MLSNGKVSFQTHVDGYVQLEPSQPGDGSISAVLRHRADGL